MSQQDNTPRQPCSNWAKLRSDPAYRKRVAERASVIAATQPFRERWKPPLNVPIPYIIKNADIDQRKNSDGTAYADYIWVDLQMNNPLDPDNGRIYRHFFDLPRYTKKKDGTALTFDRGTAGIKAFLMALGVDAKSAGDETAWPDLFAGIMGLGVMATLRVENDSYTAKKANPEKGIAVGQTITRQNYVLHDIKEIAVSDHDYDAPPPAMDDEYAGDDSAEAEAALPASPPARAPRRAAVGASR